MVNIGRASRRLDLGFLVGADVGAERNTKDRTNPVSVSAAVVRMRVIGLPLWGR
jgi:hypothetical protein